MTFRLLIQKPPSLSNERLLGTSFDCQLSYYTAGNATLKVGVLEGVIIDKGKNCLRSKFTVQTKDNARLSCCFEIVPAFWLSDFRIFRLCQNSVQHATSFRCTRGLVKYTMKEKKKSTNILIQLRLISVYLNLNGSVRKIVKNCRTFLNFFARREENGGQRRVHPYAFDACHNFFSIKTIMLAQIRKMSDDDAT